MATLEIIRSLPSELLTCIAAQLNHYDLCNLRLSCRWAASATRLLVFKTLRIDLRADLIDRHLPKFRAIVNEEHPAIVDRITTLLVMGLTPYQMSIWGAGHYYTSDYTEEVRETLDLLWLALPRLKHISNIEWYMNKQETLGSPERFFNIVLLQYQRLESFHLNHTVWHWDPKVLTTTRAPDKSHPPFQGLQGLRSFNLSYHDFSADASSAIATSIERSPNLSSLDITQHEYAAVWRHETPWCIFNFIDRTSSMPRLQRLAIKCYFTFQPTDAFPHHPIIQNLRSLVLNIKSESGCAAFWREWDANGIHLEDISVEYVPFELISYLMSYSGLRNLRIRGHEILTHIKRLTMAISVWQDALGCHSASLRELSITGRQPDAWAYNTQRAWALLKCTKLRRLEVSMEDRSVRGSDYSLYEDPELSQIAMDVIKDVVAFLPNVETLRLVCFDQPRNAECRQQLLRTLKDEIVPDDTFGRLKYLYLNPTEQLVCHPADEGGVKGVRWVTTSCRTFEDWSVAEV